MTEFFATKAQAVASLKSKGYIPTGDLGESGDHGYGSRIYFRNSKTDHAVLCNHDATVSKVGRQWATSIFDEK